MSSGAMLVEFDAGRIDELVSMWRASFERGVGVIDPHPLAEQRHYFLRNVLPHHRVRLALLGNELVAFIAASDQSIAQLYVRVGFERRGIGTLLVDWAKQNSSGTLWLYTFARNLGACAFYERQGFRVSARGYEPSWQLEDIKYQWFGRSAHAV